ncbi:hypothetical protein CPB83DRAFT_24240 [Crepidotus variabilis]|uniref:Kinase-like protein n=1 Tax=Crepidotus variabilis TaxID=179855 RepID=A0A9P6EVC7_9AGAR|nr:hypothetical protein CPB83DRAFT_24240 [Crepidotus variabilis]
MKALDTNLPSTSRRGAARMDQDGPWNVSVAETPYDPHSYSLYIKTPTHNLTLTRTGMEIVELDVKLRQSYSSVKLPALPLAPDTLPVPPKRKSTFLNTLSRLASPTSKHQRRPTAGGATPQSAGAPGLPPIPTTTPLASPSKEHNDPFSSFMSSGSGLNGDAESPAPSGSGSPEGSETVPQSATTPTPSATSTALASYFTTISNLPQVKADRVWKRFVRVRTDDLESVRVERAIKRVRSDLAAHVGNGSSSRDKENSMDTTFPNSMDSPQAESTENVDIHEEKLEEPQAAVEETTDAKVNDNAKDIAEDVSSVEEKPGEGHPSKEANVIESTLTQDGPQDEDSSVVDASDTAVETTTVVEDDDEPIQDGSSVPTTPHVPDISSRIPRSQSAEPHKAHRFSRNYASSMASQTGAESQTGDESSSSVLNGSKHSRRRKKRSDSRVPKEPKEPKKSHRKVAIHDFEMMRVLGKGCAGKVLLVRHKSTADLFALKAITKRHVLAHQELQHTLTEQAVLKKMAAENRDPFVVKLWWSFHDKENLFLVMDFHPGGDLATQLARWGRLGRDRARFYAAEIVEGVEGLHAAGVIYRDLKPENILIGGDGHIVLTDFGLSKEFPRNKSHTVAANGFYSSVPGTPQPATPPWMKQDRNGDMASGWPGQPIGHIDSTTTFCGTAEYLAPEVIQGLPYSYEVDWWSFGTMLYEMLTGITPFWANNHSDMYVRVLQDELQFPEDRAIDQDTKSLVRGLLQRVPTLRICEPRIKKHPYFSMIDWSHVYYKRYIPPYIPPIDPSNASDTQNFDDTFLDMEPVLDEYNDDGMDTDQEPNTDTERTDGEESNTTPSQSRSSSIRPQSQPPLEEDVDVFDGYSFKGRHSVLIDEEEEEGSEDASGESIEGDEDDNLSLLRGTDQRHSPQPDPSQLEDEEGLGPKTPEARPSALPPVSEKTPDKVEEPEVVPITSEPAKEEEVVEAVPAPEPKEESTLSKQKSSDLAPSVPAEVQQPPTPPPKPASRQTPNIRTGRSRKERSGVPALDRYIDEDAEVTEAEREDEDWDFVEAGDGEDRNGAKGTSLFARGVVDKYRLKVFGKPSTPSRNGQRVASGLSMTSSTTAADSPSPSQRRGRTPLTFRKHPREFLRAKSPPSSFSNKSARSLSQSATASMSHSATTSNANTLSAASTSSMGGLLTPSLSQSSNTFANSPSLKSKESATSMGAQSQSSDQSNGQSAVFVEASDAIRTPPQDTKQKKMKLKKYKNNAEKVLSLFSSPRQNQL